MRNRNWNRQYRFEATTSDGTGFVIGPNKAVDGTTIHISFSFEKSKDYTFNRCSINLWNLCPEHIAVLDHRECNVKLYAGYDDELAQLYQGVVLEMKTTISGGDRQTTIEVADTWGNSNTKNAYVSIAYRGNQNAKAVLEDIAKRMDVPVLYSPSAEKSLRNASFAHSASFSGDCSYVIESIVNTCGLGYYVDNGSLNVFKEGEAMKTYATEMSNAKGLIGIPEREYKSESTSYENNQNTHAHEVYGYKIKYLMDGVLGLGDRIHLKTDYLDGYFHIYKISVSGDNLSGDWNCTAHIVEDGKLPEDNGTTVLGNKDSSGNGGGYGNGVQKQ